MFPVQIVINKYLLHICYTYPGYSFVIHFGYSFVIYAQLMSTAGGRFRSSISFVFDQFSDNLFTTSHMHNLANSLAYLIVLIDCYRHKNNIFVSSAKVSIHIIIHIINHVKCD